MKLPVRGGVCESTVTVLFPGESEQTVNGGAAMPIFSDSTSLSTAFFLQEQSRLQGHQKNGPTDRAMRRTNGEGVGLGQPPTGFRVREPIEHENHGYDSVQSSGSAPDCVSFRVRTNGRRMGMGESRGERDPKSYPK